MRHIILPARLDQEAVRQLVQDMQNILHDSGVTIDGSAVEKTGLAGLQLLASALRSASPSSPISLTSASPDLLRAAHLAGLSDALSLPRPHQTEERA
jgi:anti-anti-sigma regulatory factor